MKSSAKRLASLALTLAMLLTCVASIAGASSQTITFPLPETYTVKAFAFSENAKPLNETPFFTLMEEKTNIHWDLTLVSDVEINEKRGLSFNSGDYYDVYIRSGITAIEAAKYAKQGIIIPLNDLIDQYMPNLKRVLDERDLWNDIKAADGNIYSLPQIHGAGLASPHAFINQKWLDAVGKKEPTTPEEFLDVLRAFKTGDPNGNGQQDEIPMYLPNAISYYMPYFGIAMDWNTMSSYDMEAKTMKYIPTSNEYKEFLRFFATCYKEGLLNQDTYTTSWDNLGAIGTTTDTLGAFITWGAYTVVGKEKDEDWPTMLPLAGNTIPINSGIFYGGLSITDKCERPELICAWADWLYSEEGGRFATMGIEGETYKLGADGKSYEWILSEKYGMDTVTVQNAMGFFGWYPIPYAASQLSSYKPDAEEQYLTIQRNKLLAYGAKPFPVLSWTDDELKEKTDLVTAINTSVFEYEALVVTGQQDLDATWDSHVAAIEAMGLERLKAIDKAAFDRWLADRPQ